MPAEALPASAARFWTPTFLWFYIYSLATVMIFALFWFSPHRWQQWSILGLALIIFATCSLWRAR